MKKLVVVSGSRSEWSGLKMFCKLARHSSAFDLKVIAAGMHLMEKHGYTYRDIEADGFEIAGIAVMDSVVFQYSQAWALTHGIGRLGYLFETMKPDAVMIEGDRIEALATCLAAAYLGIPVYHAGGGDVSGCIDDKARTAISAFAECSFVSHDAAKERLKRMGIGGEVFVTGALGIDAIMQTEFPPREQVLADLGLPPDSRYLLVCFHPETGHEEHAGDWMGNLLRACHSTGFELVITYPNSDPGSASIIEAIQDWQDDWGDGYGHVFPNLGTRYLPALRYADALVGNSSSGLYEAPSLRVPVVNVGHRQDGRPRALNVIDCGYSYGAITEALNCALGERFRKYILPSTQNVYGDGHAAERMMEIIERRLGE